MPQIDQNLMERIDRYIEDLFTPPDTVLTANLQDAAAAGLPEIQVSPNQGHFIYLLAKIAGAKRVLEIGTLGGYSTTWLARALPPGGRVVSLEIDAKHAEVARRNLKRAELDAAVEVRVGPASESLQAMIDASEDAFDLIFIDADKVSYPRYLEYAMRLSRVGTVILADNVIRNGGVLEPNPSDSNNAGAKVYNEAIARDGRLDSIVLPIVRQYIDGLAISIVRSL